MPLPNDVAASVASDADRVLVVIPAYNAAPFLPELLQRLRTYVRRENMLVVDDGSTDATSELLRARNIPFISHRENHGKGAALATGFRYAVAHGYRSVVTLDADLQHRPEEIPRLLSRADGAAVVIGTRNISLRDMPLQRRFVNNITSLIVSIFSAVRVRDSQSGFRLLPVALLRRIDLRSAKYDFESELLFKAGALGYPIREAPISTVYNDSSSHIRPVVDTLRFIRQMWRRVWA